MKINPTNSYNQIYEDKVRKAKTEEQESTESKKVKNDSLELSPEVLKYGPIQSKIKEGFYENEDVLNKVSEKLLRELKL
jgi:hypothetical protein